MRRTASSAARRSKAVPAALLLAASGPALASCGTATGDSTASETPVASGTAATSDSPTGSDTSAGSSRSSAPTGSSTEDTAAAASVWQQARPATGRVVRADRLSLRLPRGWVDITGQTSGPALLTAVDVRADDDPPSVTVTRVRTTPAGVVPATSASRRRLDSLGMAKVRALPPVEVAGTTLTHVTAVDPAPGTHAQLDEFAAPDGSAYVVTFRTSRWQVAEDRQRMMASVLASCTW